MSENKASRASEAVRDAFERDQVPFLARLVEQPSATSEPSDVEAAAQILDEGARELGLAIERHEDASGRYAAHRVYRTPACGERDRALALVGHVDTVFPRAMQFFGFTRDGDVARGPGVLDMKSGLTSVLFALRALRDASPASFASLRARFVVVSDEEVGSPTSAPLFASLAPRTTEALVFEAGRDGDRIVTRRKGGGAYELVGEGRAAHSGNRHADGASAIWALALAVPRIEALTDYTRGVTLNVGVFEGGSAKNTVPERARILVDTRYERIADAAATDAALRAIASDPFAEANVPERLRAVRVSLRGGVTRPPMEPTERTTALRLRYEAHASACGLGVGEAPLQGGGSDACLLAAAGVPSIDGLGPAGQHFHETREWCSLSSLERRTIALASFLEAHQ